MLFISRKERKLSTTCSCSSADFPPNKMTTTATFLLLWRPPVGGEEEEEDREWDFFPSFFLWPDDPKGFWERGGETDSGNLLIGARFPFKIKRESQWKTQKKHYFYSVQNLNKWRESYFIVFYIVYAHATCVRKNLSLPLPTGEEEGVTIFFPLRPTLSRRRKNKIRQPAILCQPYRIKNRPHLAVHFFAIWRKKTLQFPPRKRTEEQSLAGRFIFTRISFLFCLLCQIAGSAALFLFV